MVLSTSVTKFVLRTKWLVKRVLLPLLFGTIRMVNDSSDTPPVSDGLDATTNTVPPDTLTSTGAGATAGLSRFAVVNCSTSDRAAASATVAAVTVAPVYACASWSCCPTSSSVSPLVSPNVT